MTDANKPSADQLRNEARSAAVLAEAQKKHVFQRTEEAAAQKPRHRSNLKWTLCGLLLLAILLTAFILVIKTKELLTPNVDLSIPDSLSGLLPDEKMGYSKVDFSNAILGESREKSDFVVLEQDVTVTSRVSQALANLALFEKSQVIRSYGTGVYTVDLSALSDGDVAMDEALQTITVTIPHATLAYVTVDLDKTEYDETQKALFAFGEIKLTNEQRDVLEQSIDEAMRAQLTSEQVLLHADVLALQQIQALFAPIVQAIAKDFSVVVTFAS